MKNFPILILQLILSQNIFVASFLNPFAKSYIKNKIDTTGCDEILRTAFKNKNIVKSNVFDTYRSVDPRRVSYFLLK